MIAVINTKHQHHYNHNLLHDYHQHRHQPTTFEMYIIIYLFSINTKQQLNIRIPKMSAIRKLVSAPLSLNVKLRVYVLSSSSIYFIINIIIHIANNLVNPILHGGGGGVGGGEHEVPAQISQIRNLVAFHKIY